MVMLMIYITFGVLLPHVQRVLESATLVIFLISGGIPFHSYGPLIWKMNDFHEFFTSIFVPPKVFTFYKCSDMQVCISPRAPQDNKVITIQSIGHTRGKTILHT